MRYSTTLSDNTTIRVDVDDDDRERAEIYIVPSEEDSFSEYWIGALKMEQPFRLFPESEVKDSA